jgi:hypothetical protein
MITFVLERASMGIRGGTVFEVTSKSMIDVGEKKGVH